MTYFRILAYIFILTVTNPAPAFSFSVEVVPNGGMMAGHEEITRQAILYSKEIFNDLGFEINAHVATSASHDNEIRNFWKIFTLDANILGVSGRNSKNPLIKGNYAADKPNHEDRVDIRAINGFPAKGNLLNYGGARAFHFTRNQYKKGEEGFTYTGEDEANVYEFQSAYEACTEATDRIKLFTRTAFELVADIKLGSSEAAKVKMSQELEKAMLLLGAATHTIQDSFSPSHTYRSVDAINGNNDILDVCYYNTDILHAGEDLLAIFSTYYGDTILSVDKRKTALEAYVKDMTGRIVPPCEHRKVDANDFIWMRSKTHADIFLHEKGQNWAQIEKHYLSKNKKLEKSVPLFDHNDVEDACSTRGLGGSNAIKHACMKHEARLARTATIKYYLLVQEFFYKNFRLPIKEGRVPTIMENLDDLIERQLPDYYFEGNIMPIFNKPSQQQVMAKYGLDKVMRKGVIRCSVLKENNNRRYIAAIPEEEDTSHVH